ncbi:MAG: class I SAM-dependent methyltransferase [Spartobacteria bacterium]|nr:class I SAM-dependent methyltransferase [Spartobacteria bacterium]
MGITDVFFSWLRPDNKLQQPDNALSDHWREASEAGISRIKKAMEVYYYTGWRDRTHYEETAYLADLNAHMHERLRSSRQTVIPWIHSLIPLSGASILEIGCGTGASTVALAEQGATVCGCDLDKGALEVAGVRCEVYHVDACLDYLNAVDIKTHYHDRVFDVIIFYACLEHMTVPERLQSLRIAWDMLNRGGLLCVVETPNRLWFKDRHTSLLPFYHWLPDELAFLYSKFSTRENFRELYRDESEVSMEHFLRRGRGMSYHEIEVAIDSVDHLSVEKSLDEFIGSGARTSEENKYVEFLMAQSAGIPEVFFYENLDFALRK